MSAVSAVSAVSAGFVLLLAACVDSSRGGRGRGVCAAVRVWGTVRW